MEIRYGANQNDARYYDTRELREEFLIKKLFEADQIVATYSHIDRIIVIGVMPVEKELDMAQFIDSGKQLGTAYFLERRELGIINIGGAGYVLADGINYKLSAMDGLYIGMTTQTISFKSEAADQPAKFYMCSAPAHKKFDTKFITKDQANKVELGSQETSNERTIYQFIHPAVLETCQLSMGCTLLSKGSVWNTMPTHTHERRMEVYMYFDISGENIVFHMMGEPTETRHIIMKNEQAIISPSWSIHSGCGTSNYAFIWSMAGENRTFTDMDPIKNTDLL